MTCNYSKRQLENGPVSISFTVITFLTADLLPKLEVLGFKCCRMYLNDIMMPIDMWFTPAKLGTRSTAAALCVAESQLGHAARLRSSTSTRRPRFTDRVSPTAIYRPRVTDRGYSSVGEISMGRNPLPLLPPPPRR